MVKVSLLPVRAGRTGLVISPGEKCCFRLQITVKWSFLCKGVTCSTVPLLIVVFKPEGCRGGSNWVDVGI